LILRY